MPKRIRDLKMMKVAHNRMIGKAILPGTSKTFTMKFSAICMKQVLQSRMLGQLDFLVLLRYHRI
jgi:hypothetical protein